MKSGAGCLIVSALNLSRLRCIHFYSGCGYLLATSKPSSSPSSTTTSTLSRAVLSELGPFEARMKLHLSPVVVLGTFFAALVRAQTSTITDAAGNTIIEVITIDPVQEIPVTSTIETIPAAATQTTSTTTPVDQQQGPVAQPAATEAGQTTFRYTTTDAAGDTIVVTDTFTPSFAPTAGTTPLPTFVGSILSYSQWLSAVGTNTVPVANAAVERWRFPRSLLSVGSAMAAGAAGGVWLVLG